MPNIERQKQNQPEGDLTARLTERHGLSLDRAQQVVKNLRGFWPLGPQARLSSCFSDDRCMSECMRVIALLRSIGFMVSVTPCSGILEPRLMLGSRQFCGGPRIERLADEILSRFIQGIPKEELVRGCH